MRNKAEVTLRIEALAEQLQLVAQKKDAELEKDRGKRDFRLLNFLTREQSLYEFSILELQWVLSSD